MNVKWFISHYYDQAIFFSIAKKTTTKRRKVPSWRKKIEIKFVFFFLYFLFFPLSFLLLFHFFSLFFPAGVFCLNITLVYTSDLFLIFYLNIFPLWNLMRFFFPLTFCLIISKKKKCTAIFTDALKEQMWKLAGLAEICHQTLKLSITGERHCVRSL